MRYTRIYADDEGESHFEEVEVPTERQRAAESQLVGDVSAPVPVSGLVFRAIVEEDPAVERHNAPRRQFIVHLAGSAEVETSDGEFRTFGPGSVMLVEDTSGAGHRTRATSAEPRLTLVAPLADELPVREQAAALFNRTWAYLRKPERSAAEDDAMLHCAHASRHAWGEVEGVTTAQLARGEWLCSRVYATLGRAEPARFHGERGLALCEADPGALAEWDLPFAHEALARAAAVAADGATRDEHLAIARRLAAQISDDEDRGFLEDDLATIV